MSEITNLLQPREAHFPISDSGLAILKSAMVHDVSEELAVRTSRRRGYLLAFAGLLLPLLLILSGVIGKIYIERQVDDRFKTLQGEVLSELLFHRDLATLSLAIDNLTPSNASLNMGYSDVVQHYERMQRDYFSEQNAQAANRMRELRTTIMDVTSSKTEDFARRGAPAQFATFVVRFRAMTGVVSGDFQTVTRAMGRELLGARHGAKTWMDVAGELSGILPAWQEVISTAENAGYPELRLAYDPIRIWMQNPDDPRLPKLVSEIDEMQEVDLKGYEAIVVELLSEGWRTQSDWYSGNAKRNTLGFLNQFSCQSEMVLKMLQAYEVLLAAEGRQFEMPACL